MLNFKEKEDLEHWHIYFMMTISTFSVKLSSTVGQSTEHMEVHNGKVDGQRITQVAIGTVSKFVAQTLKTKPSWRLS